MNSLSQQQIIEIMDRVMKDITNRMDEIRRSTEDSIFFSENVCSIHTTFEGGYHATLALSVDTSLLVRLAQKFMQEEDVPPDDLEDFAKEYFNVICGHIAAKLFQIAHISSRFEIPTFSAGRYTPDKDSSSQEVLNYTNNRNEGAQLIHQTSSKLKSAE